MSAAMFLPKRLLPKRLLRNVRNQLKRLYRKVSLTNGVKNNNSNVSIQNANETISVKIIR